MKKTFTKQTTVKKLASYSTFAGAFVLMNTAANAQIIYTDIPDETISAGDSYDLDMNDDGDIDFTLNMSSISVVDLFYTITNHTIYYDGFINFVRIYPNSGNAVNGYTTNTFSGGIAAYPYALDNGDEISSGQTFIESSIQNLAIYFTIIDYPLPGSTYPAGNNGLWGNKNSKFLGVRFNADGDDYYGWVRLTTEDLTLTIEDFAYYASPEFEIGAGDMPTAIQSAISELQLNAYSFGNTINLVVKDAALEGASVHVFNIDGQKVYNGNLNLNGMNIALENASTGNYTLQVISTSNDVYTRQLYIQN